MPKWIPVLLLGLTPTACLSSRPPGGGGGGGGEPAAEGEGEPAEGEGEPAEGEGEPAEGEGEPAEGEGEGPAPAEGEGEGGWPPDGPKPPVTPCEDDSDCEAADACPSEAARGCACRETPVGRVCVPVCEQDEDCPTMGPMELTCEDGMCVPGRPPQEGEGEGPGPGEGEGELVPEATYKGYTLFDPHGSETSYLLGMDNRTVHTWEAGCVITSMAYLRPDGLLLRPCQVARPDLRGAAFGGRFQLLDWGGGVVWDWTYSSEEVIHHHDIQPMDNGNVLLIAWEVKSAQESRAVGRSDGVELWPLHIVEVEPVGRDGGEIVWEWHLWDHLLQDVDETLPGYGDPADHPELIDINLGRVRGGDWIHANHIDHDPVRDEIVFSSHFLHEVYVIDHSTTTEEAAGHTGGNHGRGGDILYRWGNPQTYGLGAERDRKIFVVHGANFVDAGMPGAGNILLFNNGDRQGRDDDWSVVQELVPPRDDRGRFLREPDEPFGPEEPVWSYSDPGRFYSNHLAGAYRLPNGNTLVIEATSAHLLEVTAEGEVVWEYTYVGGRRSQITRAMRYGRDDPRVAALEE